VDSATDPSLFPNSKALEPHVHMAKEDQFMISLLCKGRIQLRLCVQECVLVAAIAACVCVCVCVVRSVWRSSRGHCIWMSLPSL
jgi:hypothetical protein